MPDDIYRVRITDIFEGPMDLLVHLIIKNEVDIYDIPIALITKQYLDYIQWLESMNIELAGDFLVMAATLTQIKSKMLLPTAEDDDQEDPREEITRPIMEYLQLKSAADDLAGRALLGKDTFTKGHDDADYLIGQGEDLIKIGLFELIDAFQKILKNISSDHLVDLTADNISVKDRISEIVDIFEKQNSVTFNELFPSKANKSDVIITFLAILEMVKLNLVKLAQHAQTGIIRLFYI
ncbi:MAG: segregation/condensation protein A [Thermodesulfobacteriota bacterium]|nr:segregation/condensation protein A [Thermodesulfobacteriota bacterium]